MESSDGKYIRYCLLLWGKSKPKPRKQIILIPTDYDGNTLLHQAVHRGDGPLAELLLKQARSKHTNVGYTPSHTTFASRKMNDIDLLNTEVDVNATNKFGNTPLHAAARNKNQSVLNLLLNNGADIKIKNEYGNTPLHVAACYGNASCIKLLLKHGADLETTNKAGLTPLFEAVVVRKTSIVDLLVRSGADVITTDTFGDTALHMAVSRGYATLVDQLLKYGADFNRCNNYDHTPLHLAVLCENTVIVELLLKYGADAKTTYKAGDTLLHIAVAGGDASLVDLLVRSGADVNTANKEGNTPLHVAVQCRNATIVELLLDAGADMKATNINGNMPLHIAMKCRSMADVDLLLKFGAEAYGDSLLHDAVLYGKSILLDLLVLLNFGAEINMKYNYGFTALHLATYFGNTAFVKLFLKNGADVDIKNEVGKTALYLAMNRGSTSLVKELLNSGADANIKSNTGNTPLHEAVRGGYMLIADLLLKFGANVNEKNNSGTTPLHVAVEWDDVTLVSLLLKHGADTTIMNYFGNALHVAARNGNAHIVNLLLEYMKEVNMKNSGGETPLHLAAAHGNASIVDLLLQCDVDLESTNNAGYTPLLAAVTVNKTSVLDLVLKSGAVVNTIIEDGDIRVHLVVACEHATVVDQFLKCGADMIRKNNNGDTSVHLVIGRGALSVVDLLLLKKASVSVKNNDSETPLLLALNHEDAAYVDLLLQYEADVNTKDIYSVTPLHKAVSHGNVFIVDQLLKLGADTNVVNSFGKTPLHIAAGRGDMALVDKLLEFGAEVNTRNGDTTPLHVAISHGNMSLVNKLLNSGADVNIRDEDGDTPLHKGTCHGDTALVDLLLKNGADVKATNNAGDTPLHIAASYMKIPTIYLLLKYGADVSITNRDNVTPLHLAVHRGDTSIVDLLLKYGADVKTTNKAGDTLLHTAVACGDAALVELLLRSEADVSTASDNGNMPLHTAVKCGNVDVVDLLLKFGAEVNVKDSHSGNTSLHMAIDDGNSALVDLLLKSGVDVTIANKHGDTPLHLVVCGKDATFVDMLLKFGAEANTRNSVGNTPLHLVACGGDEALADLLLKYGADVSMTNKYGKTPLHLAVHHGRVSLVHVLLNSGAAVNVKSRTGDTPLHEAARRGYQSIADQLLKFGADVNSANSTGNTPLHMAARRGDLHIVDLLLGCGADATIRNLSLETSLTVTRVFNFAGYEDIVRLLEIAENFATDNILPNKDRSIALCNIFQGDSQISILNKDQQNARPGFKYLKRAGTSGMSGQLYETKLLSLVLIRALNDDEIEYFLLGTNICGIGDLNDICLRYRVRGQDIPVVLFVLAKHRENHEKGKLTVEDVRNSSGDFSLRKYFKSYLLIKERFQAGNKDPMFEGNFDDVERHFIIYTPVKDCFAKKKTDRQLCDKVHKLINTGTGRTTEVFQYDYDENDVGCLAEMTAIEQLKKFGIALLELIMSQKDISKIILGDKLIARYHVMTIREVLKNINETQEKRKDEKKVNIQESKGYHIWKFRPEFFESDCRYLLALKDTFIKELSTKRYDKSKITDEDLENVKRVLRNPCASTISKIIGKLASYNGKTKQLKLLKVSAFIKNLKKNEFKILQERFNKIVSCQQVINKAVRIKLTAMDIKLPLAFGNSDMIFRGSDAKKRRRIKAVADKLINIFEKNKDSKIVIINDNDVGPGKSIEKGIIDINGGIGSAVGNLLVLDTNTKMLKFDLNIKALPKNAALFLEELKDGRFKPINEDLSSFRIKVSIDVFPKDTFEDDEFDKQQARTFLENVWFYTNQAKENEVERILKNHINTYYNYEKEPNNFLFEIHSNAIFLRSHDEIQKWWLQKGETSYLSHANDVFERAKVTCINHLLLTVIDYMQCLEIFGMDLKFNQRIYQCETSMEVRGAFNNILGKLFDIFDIQNKSINISVMDKKEIVKLLQTAENLVRDNAARSCDTAKSAEAIFQSNLTPSDAQLKFKYSRRAGSSGASGQLYETKLLCLILIRALNDDEIEHFLLGTNIRDIGDMDDICLRYQVKGHDRPIVLFVQAKHRENPEKGKLTVEDMRQTSGDFSLRRYFESYLKIKDRFKANNEDPMFEVDFNDVECNLIIYTPIKDYFTKKKTDRQLSDKVHCLINTGPTTEVFQYDYDETDIDYLTELIVMEQIKKMSLVFLELIMSQKDKLDVVLVDKLVARYHVIIGREVLQPCNIQENKEHRIWQFRPEFFESDCKYLLTLTSTFMKELLIKVCDKSKITDIDRENVKLVLQDPCASTISNIIGKLATYNNEKKQLQLVENSIFKEKFKRDEFKILQERFKKIVINEHVVREAIKIKLIALKIKLPLSFGNVDMIFRGNDARVRRRMKSVAGQLINLLKENKKTKIVDINVNVVGPGKDIERGIIDISGGIGSAVGNLLIMDADTKMLKFDSDNKALPDNAAMFFKELKDEKFEPINEELSSYRIKMNIDGFPKNSFKGDEFDKQQAREFLNKLWFYTNQAKEDEVERILKNEINKYYNKEIDQNRIKHTNISDSVYLSSHDEIQKWWMQKGETPYLSRASKLFERAELADYDNLLLTVINYMYISGIYSIDINMHRPVTDYFKFVQMHQTFNKMSRRLFKIFDSEFDEAIDIKLPAPFLNSEIDLGSVDFSCDLVFSLEINPEMEWVALKFFVNSKFCGIFRNLFYSLIAKAGPGNGHRRPKDGFLLQQRFYDRPHYFIEGGKDPLESEYESD